MSGPAGSANRYRRLLREPGVVRVLVPHLLARLPVSMVLLALLLMVRASERSFGRAGLVSAAYGIAAGLSGPLLGRLVDRKGQTRTLIACGLGYALTLGWTVYASARLSFAAVVAGAALAGVAAPPISACMRALWPTLVEDDDLRETAYALDGLLIEAAELAGPLMVAGLAAFGGPSVAVLVAAGLTSVGTLLFALTKPSRVAVRSTREFHWAGPLRLRGVRALLLVITASTAGFGCFEVAVVGFATRHGASAGSGVLLACMTAGSIVGGLWYGARSWAAPLTRQLAWLLGVVATLSLLPLLAPNQVVMGLLLVVTGIAVAPSLIVQLSLMSRITTPESRTEAFTWGGTANFAGVAAGAALAGILVERFSPTAGFVAAAGAALAAVGIAAAFRGWLTPAEEDVAEDAGDDVAEGAAADVAAEAAAEPEPATVVPLRTGVDLRLPLVLAGGEERTRLLRVLRRVEELAASTEAAAAARRAEAEHEAQAILMRAEVQALRLVASAEERASEILADARGEAAEIRAEDARVLHFPGTGS
jgi:MFS family permease